MNRSDNRQGDTEMNVDMGRGRKNSNGSSPKASASSQTINSSSSSSSSLPPSPSSNLMTIPCTGGMQIDIKWISLVLLILQSTVLVLAISYSRFRPSTEKYLTSTAIVASEALKVVASCLILVYEKKSISYVVNHLNEELRNIDTLRMSVPGILYLIQNNLLFIALSNLDAAVYQVTYQMKILTTAIFSVTMLGSSISRMQFFSLILLTAGVSLVQLAKMDKDEKKSASLSDDKNPTLGLICVMLACISSGFAGVYLEKVMKKGRQVSIWVRNVQLGIFGAVIGFGGIFMYDFNTVSKNGFFHGYDSLVWFVVFNQALGGLM